MAKSDPNKRNKNNEPTERDKKKAKYTQDLDKQNLEPRTIEDMKKYPDTEGLIEAAKYIKKVSKKVSFNIEENTEGHGVKEASKPVEEVLLDSYNKHQNKIKDHQKDKVEELLKSDEKAMNFISKIREVAKGAGIGQSEDLLYLISDDFETEIADKHPKLLEELPEGFDIPGSLKSIRNEYERREYITYEAFKEVFEEKNLTIDLQEPSSCYKIDDRHRDGDYMEALNKMKKSVTDKYKKSTEPVDKESSNRKSNKRIEEVNNKWQEFYGSKSKSTDPKTR